MKISIKTLLFLSLTLAFFSGNIFASDVEEKLKLYRTDYEWSTTYWLQEPFVSAKIYKRDLVEPYESYEGYPNTVINIVTSRNTQLKKEQDNTNFPFTSRLKIVDIEDTEFADKFVPRQRPFTGKNYHFLTYKEGSEWDRINLQPTDEDISNLMCLIPLLHKRMEQLNKQNTISSGKIHTRIYGIWSIIPPKREYGSFQGWKYHFDVEVWHGDVKTTTAIMDSLSEAIKAADILFTDAMEKTKEE
ncbi:hypothetical protein ACFLRA_00755 [Bdellovibrionota bacterium]